MYSLEQLCEDSQQFSIFRMIAHFYLNMLSAGTSITLILE